MSLTTRFLFLVFMFAWRASTVAEAALEPGDVCNDNGDCSTNRCFQGFRSTTKVCACNSETSAGCSEGQICSDDPIAYDGLPECRDPGDDQVGDECEVDSDCQTLRCFYGFQPPDTPGTCACNSNTNAGCPEGQICSDDPIAYDGWPECREPVEGQIGDECENNSDCESRRCLPSQVVDFPGSCQCNSNTNAGCSEGQICSDDPLAYDGLPECQDQCIVEFILYNANTDEALHTLKAQEYQQDFPLSIVARPSSACGATGSARLTLAGRINSERTENSKPYAVFGDEEEDLNGRNFRTGAYTINAELYSKRRRRGKLVASASFDFVVVKKNRVLRNEE